MDTYRLQVAGLERDLPVCPLGNGVSIAGFVMFSDVELTIACATELLKKLPEHDVLLTCLLYTSAIAADAVFVLNLRFAVLNLDGVRRTTFSAFSASDAFLCVDNRDRKSTRLNSSH